ICSFFIHLSGTHRDLHSFPTRRSSDLKPAPTVSGFRDVEGEVSKVVEENQRIEMESAAQHMVDRLHGTDEPLQFKGKMYEGAERSEEHTSELQSRGHLVCRLLLEKKKT